MCGSGGFRTRAGMEAALGTDGAGECDVIGLGRPLCWSPAFPRRLMEREVDGIENLDARLRLAQDGLLGPASPLLAARALNAFAAQSWYYTQIFRLAAGEPPQLGRSVFATLAEYLVSELKAARATRREYPRGRG